MIKKVLVRGPALTRSGYGEHTRFVLRSLRKNEDKFDIYLHTTNWGETGWIKDDSEERRWIDSLLIKNIKHSNEKKGYDISIQVTIPNEWEKLAPINIGVTAGIETTKVAPIWLEKSNIMDKIVTISKHSQHGFINTIYEAVHKETNQKSILKCETPVEVVHYPVREYEKIDLDINLEADFNFLVMAQWGPRKNIHNTITWFIEEFIDQDVGLVLKIFGKNNSIIDRSEGEKQLKKVLDEYPKRKCKIYFLHGDMTDQEMYSLYNHPKIKSFITLAHGEGFGLPVFEAAYCGLPVIAPDWSGYTDFLYMPKKEKNNKLRPMFARVDYDLRPILKEAVWDGVLEADSLWCYAKKESYKMKLREVYNQHGRYKKNALRLKEYILENFSAEKQYKCFINALFDDKSAMKDFEYVFVSDMFSNQIGTGTGIGGAELSLQNLINVCPKNNANINSSAVTETHITAYKDKKWIFGNYSGISDKLLDLLTKNNINYSVVEFDYKFCKYRNLDLHKLLEEKKCDCISQPHGQYIERFLTGAQNVFFMSEAQKNIHLENLSHLVKEKCVVLSSVFSNETLDNVLNLRKKYEGKKQNVWVTLGTTNWVKGSQEAQGWCKKNNLDFVVLENKDHTEALEMLAGAKGLCFTPAGADTCPRLVIEAKLLGCELNLNKNVQHTKEEWFDTDDLNKVENYLREVPERFWSYFGE